MVRKALETDLERIMEIYAHGKKIQDESGNPTQWAGGYPQKEMVLDDIKKGQSYVVCNDKDIIGVFCYFIGDDPTYEVIEEGKWLNDEPYGVIHRIASVSKGVFDEALGWCIKQNKNLRIDTHKDNKIMQHLLNKNGFSYCGIITVYDGTKRMAYQL